mgnify:CR=1 FL=1
MSNLGNQKIKDTYQLVLQTDASGNLQRLDGTTPNPFIVNGNLRYVDGTQSNGYVLISNTNGDASWGPVDFTGDVYVSGGTINGTTIDLNASSGGTISIPGLSWSSSTSGHISNSGLTGNVGVGTSTPNEKLTVVGGISATTDVQVGGKLNLTSLGTAYISLGASNKLALGSTSILYSNWKILDGSSFAFDTQSYFTAYRDPSTSRNTLKGTTGGVDITSTSNITINSATLSLGNTTSETTVQDNLTVNDNLSVGDDLTVNTNTLYVNSTGNTVGINTIDQDAILTVSGDTGTTWTAWEDDDMSGIAFTNGAPFLSYGEANITVPTPLQQEGTSVRVLVGGVYYYGTTTANGAGYGFASSRGYFGLTWSQANITITDGLENVISYGGVDVGQKIFKVYNGTNPAFQISGTSVMSGSTDLLDMFANSSVTNQDVYWSANTNGSISNSGLTGNVGIGTTVPNQKLTVSGTISGDSTMAATTYNSTTSSGGYKLNGDKYLWISSSDLQVGNVSADTDIIGTSINLQTATTINDNLTVTGNINISGTTSYNGAISGTGSVTAAGGFIGNLTGNADTVTNGVYTSNNLSVMAATTSAQLKGVLSDETGTGSVVFATSPTLVTPVLGTPASGVLTNCTGYPEAALPSSINAIKIADGTVTSTEFQYINTLSSNAQTQINTVNSTRSHFVTTTCILKVYASNTWSGFNTSTGGLNTNGFWSLDTGETDIADAYTYYDTSKNSLFTTPYAGKIKRLLINGTSQTGAAVADTINIHLAKATLTDGSDRPNWSQVTATTKTLPGTAGTTAHKSKHYVWDIPIDMAVAQYDSFLLLFKNPNNQLTWLPINILIEFEYTIT